jgi:hypothetical protein
MGVPALRNARVAEMKRALATSTATTPIGTVIEAGSNGIGQNQ